MFDVKQAREKGRQEYLQLQKKYGNSPYVDKEYQKSQRGCSVKRKIASNIKYWKTFNS